MKSQFIINILLCTSIIFISISNLIRSSEFKELRNLSIQQNNRIEKLENIILILQKDAGIKEVK